MCLSLTKRFKTKITVTFTLHRQLSEVNKIGKRHRFGNSGKAANSSAERFKFFVFSLIIIDSLEIELKRLLPHIRILTG